MRPFLGLAVACALGNVATAAIISPTLPPAENPADWLPVTVVRTMAPVRGVSIRAEDLPYSYRVVLDEQFYLRRTTAALRAIIWDTRLDLDLSPYLADPSLTLTIGESTGSWPGPVTRAISYNGGPIIQQPAARVPEPSAWLVAAFGVAACAAPRIARRGG